MPDLDNHTQGHEQQDDRASGESLERHGITHSLRVAQWCGIIACMIGVSGLLGWIFSLRVLNSILPGLKPIAISASIVFVILGVVHFCAAQTPLRLWVAIVLFSITVLMTLFGFLEVVQLTTGVEVSIEDAILRHYPSVFANPQTQIAPAAMVLVFLIALGQSVYLYQWVVGKPRRALASVVGLTGGVVVIGSALFLLGYLYGTPLFYGSDFLPVALLATIAALVLGIGLIALAGEHALPLYWFTGESTRAKLLRAFLPLTALLMLLLSLAQFLLTRLTRINPAIGAAVIISLFEIIIGIAVLQVARVMGNIIDRAEKERRQAAEELARSEAQLRTIVENLTEGVVVSTTDGELLHWNRAALVMHGFPSLEDARRRLPEFTDIFELSTIDGAVLPLAEWPLTRILRGETLRNMELRIRRLNRDWQRIFSYGGTLVYVTENQPLLAVVTISDITERKEAEVERERLLSEVQQQAQELRHITETLELRVRERTAALEATNKELEAFSYSVSHDLRAPLRSIDGFSRVLMEQYPHKLDERGRDYLTRVRNAAQRMGRLIDDMLNLSRIGRVQMSRETVDISALAISVIDDLRQRDPEREVEVEIQPGLQVSGDSALLRIVLDNLLGNAWKFTGRRDEARIEVGAVTQDHQRVFFVRDNGAGFEMSYADKLFTPFQRLHTEDEFPGTGIGLAIVQRIIARHGGRVWAEGKEGEGATIYFTLGEEQA